MMDNDELLHQIMGHVNPVSYRLGSMHPPGAPACLSFARCREISGDPTIATIEETAHFQSGCRWCIKRIEAFWLEAGVARADVPKRVAHLQSPSILRLEQSYAYCEHVAKTRARNFYYSFTVLPPEKKAAMCAIYAFMRYSDDISDEAALANDKHDLLPPWREALDRAFAGEYGDSQILPAFHDVAKRCEIPKQFFHDLIDGAEMDLTRTRYETFDDLYQYCYRVASVVGMVCTHVWGFNGGDAAYAPAEALGIAFQLTNILRDVKEDASRGRIYLPLEDLRRFEISEEELLAGRIDERYDRLLRFQISRARAYYREGAKLLPFIHPESRPTLEIMYTIYQMVLDKVEELGANSFSIRAHLPTWQKVSIVARAWRSAHANRPAQADTQAEHRDDTRTGGRLSLSDIWRVVNNI